MRRAVLNVRHHTQHAKTAKKTPEWRLFEKPVARLERTAASKHATVKSPDRILDQQTGKLRAVDASIRFRAGSEEILIVVECRRRKRKSDVTWIEELATRRQKFGAARITKSRGQVAHCTSLVGALTLGMVLSA